MHFSETSRKPINTGNCPKNWPMPIYGLLDIFGPSRSTQLNVIILKTFFLEMKRLMLKWLWSMLIIMIVLIIEEGGFLKTWSPSFIPLTRHGDGVNFRFVFSDELSGCPANIPSQWFGHPNSFSYVSMISYTKLYHIKDTLQPKTNHCSQQNLWILINHFHRDLQSLASQSTYVRLAM